MAIEANKEYVINVGGDSTPLNLGLIRQIFAFGGRLTFTDSENHTNNIQFDSIYLRSNTIGSYASDSLQFNTNYYPYNYFVLNNEKGSVSGEILNDDEDYISDIVSLSFTFNTTPDLGSYEAVLNNFIVQETPEPAPEKLITLSNLATFKEEEDTLLAGKMANPMTAQGDLVIGGTNGAPTRLQKGTAGQVLTADGSGGASWQTPQTPQGGTQLYLHSVSFNDGSTTKNIKFLSTTNQQFTNKFIIKAVFAELVAQGSYLFEGYDSFFIVFGLECSDSLNFFADDALNIYSYDYDTTGAKTNVTLYTNYSSASGFTDVVTAL